MKTKNLFLLGSIQALNIILGLLFVPQNAQASECLFDSYIIIDGKCIDLSNKSDTNTDTLHRTIYRYNYEKNSDNPGYLSLKTCSDFKQQDSAQRYFDRNSEYKRKFDGDNDGYVCEHLTRTSGNILSIKIWQSLLYENRQRKIETDNKRALTYSEVSRIIGFPHNPKQKNRRYVWEDLIANKRIEIRFHKNEISEMKGIGF